MYVLTTQEGYAYHNTDGLPMVFKTMAELENNLGWSGWPVLANWMPFEVNEEEAKYITQFAYLCIYGRRHGVDA